MEAFKSSPNLPCIQIGKIEQGNIPIHTVQDTRPSDWKVTPDRETEVPESR